MPQVFGLVGQALPTALSDAAQGQIRVGKYGEQIVIPLTFGMSAVANEGTYYRATNQVPGTATAYSITTAFSATAGFAVIRNTDSAGGKRLFMDYIRLICTTAPASATSSHFAISIDSTNRYTSGGTALTPQNANMVSANSSIGTCHIGAPTIAAASGSVRYLTRGVLFSAIPVVNTEWIINFGAGDSGSGTLAGTTAARIGIPMGPVVLGPGATHSLVLHIWNPANATTAPQYEFEAGWWER
jgi:hypothetical protein